MKKLEILCLILYVIFILAMGFFMYELNLPGIIIFFVLAYTSLNLYLYTNKFI